MRHTDMAFCCTQQCLGVRICDDICDDKLANVPRERTLLHSAQFPAPQELRLPLSVNIYERLVKCLRDMGKSGRMYQTLCDAQASGLEPSAEVHLVCYHSQEIDQLNNRATSTPA